MAKDSIEEHTVPAGSFPLVGANRHFSDIFLPLRREPWKHLVTTSAVF